MTIPPVVSRTTSPPRWVLYGGAALGLLVLFFVVEHFRDRGRDAELVQLHQQIAADSTMRVAAVAKTDSAGAKVDTVVRASARVDTVWRRAAAASVARIDTILKSTKPDTVKISELVQVDSALIVKGNALADTAQQLRAAIVGLQVSFANERASWQKERNEQANALHVSEAMHRHWGLGCTSGVGGVVTPSGSPVAGAGIVCGITYRW